jgi:hypothetical protein
LSTRGLPLSNIAQFQVTCGDDAGAIASLQKARAFAKRVPTEELQAINIFEQPLAQIYVKLNRQADLDALIADTTGSAREAAYSSAAMAFHAAGKAEEALKYAENAKLDARLRILIDVTKAKLAAGDRKGAAVLLARSTVTAQGRDEAFRTEYLVAEVARLQAAAGEHQAAAATLAGIRDPQPQWQAQLVDERVKAGDEAGGLAAAGKLTHPNARALAYQAVAKSRLGRGDKAGAVACFIQAVDAIAEGNSPSSPAEPAIVGARALYEAGAVPEARAVASHGAKRLSAASDNQHTADSGLFQIAIMQIAAADALAPSLWIKDVKQPNVRRQLYRGLSNQIIEHILEGKVRCVPVRQLKL